jgi:hypothetical protein
MGERIARTRFILRVGLAVEYEDDLSRNPSHTFRQLGSPVA